MYALLPTTISESGVQLGDDAYFRAEFRWRGEMGRRMSVKGPTATWRYVRATSALTPTPDIRLPNGLSKGGGVSGCRAPNYVTVTTFL
jgi:hypothetical protein